MSGLGKQGFARIEIEKVTDIHATSHSSIDNPRILKYVKIRPEVRGSLSPRRYQEMVGAERSRRGDQKGKAT